MSHMGDLSYFNLRRFPHRTPYVSTMRNALRQCAEVNALFRQMGEEAWGSRCDASLVVIHFHEAMARENAAINQDDAHGVFLYLSFVLGSLSSLHLFLKEDTPVILGEILIILHTVFQEKIKQVLQFYKITKII